MLAINKLIEWVLIKFNNTIHHCHQGTAYTVKLNVDLEYAPKCVRQDRLVCAPCQWDDVAMYHLFALAGHMHMMDDTWLCVQLYDSPPIDCELFMPMTNSWYIVLMYLYLFCSDLDELTNQKQDGGDRSTGTSLYPFYLFRADGSRLGCPVPFITT